MSTSGIPCLFYGRDFFYIRPFLSFPYSGHSETYHANGSENRKQTRTREEGHQSRTAREIFITFRERTIKLGKEAFGKNDSDGGGIKSKPL